MTEYGLTESGFRAKTFDEIRDDLIAAIRDPAGSEIDFSLGSFEGALVAQVSEELAILWEQTRRSNDGIDPDRATGLQVVSLAKLSGRGRLPGTRGVVPMSLTVSLPTDTVIPAFAILASVAGDSTNSWTNRSAINTGIATIAGGEIQPRAISCIFESTDVGSRFSALSGEITDLLTTFDGVSGCVNTTDATPGTDVETIEQVRLRREREKANATGATLQAIRDRVSSVPGVREVSVRSNRLDWGHEGIEPHSILVTIWDGLTQDADDSAVASAIVSHMDPGTGFTGDVSVSVGDSLVKFRRAIAQSVWIIFSVEGIPGSVATEVLAAYPTRLDERLTRSKLVEALLDAGATDASVQLGTVAWVTSDTNLYPPIGGILLLDSSRIGEVA